MAKVTLEVYPPLSHRISSIETMQILSFQEEINQDESLRELLSRIAGRNSQSWNVLFDIETHQIAPGVVSIFNGRALVLPGGLETLLSDGDRLVFVPIMAGG